MENASKALLMAGGMLLAMLVLVLLVFMFNNLTGYFSEDTQANREAQIAKFNQEYESYNREDVRGTDILSLLAKVQDYNTSQSDYRGIGAGYLPMTVVINIGQENVKKFCLSDTNVIIKSIYQQSDTKNDYDNLKKIKNNCIGSYQKDKEPGGLSKIIYHLNKKQYDKGAMVTENDLESLVAAQTIILNNKLENIYNVEDINETYSQYEYNKLILQVEKRNSLFKRIFLYDGGQVWKRYRTEIKNCVQQYYQYTQFKKAYFYCSSNGDKNSSGVEYDKNTGRITKLTFYFDYIGE